LKEKEFIVIRPEMDLALSDISIENTNLEVRLTSVNPKFEVKVTTPDITESINQMIASKKITEETNSETILQLIN
jgi:pyruvoyl-dependent arginine decarboxylase (PvlArgDC)